MNAPLEWTTQKRKVADLVAYQYNPRSLSEEKKQKLIESIDKFNLVEIPVINSDNTLIAGHQRIMVLSLKGRDKELIDVRVPNRALTKEELKEYNLRSNISLGDWVDNILESHFADIDLGAIGLEIDNDLEELLEDQKQDDAFKKEFEAIPDTPKFPIVPKYNEKYSAVIIVAKNLTDLTFLQTVLELEKNQCYKTEKVGQTFVLSSDKFQKLWEKK